MHSFAHIHTYSGSGYRELSKTALCGSIGLELRLGVGMRRLLSRVQRVLRVHRVHGELHNCLSPEIIECKVI